MSVGTRWVQAFTRQGIISLPTPLRGETWLSPPPLPPSLLPFEVRSFSHQSTSSAGRSTRISVAPSYTFSRTTTTFSRCRRIVRSTPGGAADTSAGPLVQMQSSSETIDSVMTRCLSSKFLHSEALSWRTPIKGQKANERLCGLRGTVQEHWLKYGREINRSVVCGFDSHPRHPSFKCKTQSYEIRYSHQPQ